MRLVNDWPSNCPGHALYRQIEREIVARLGSRHLAGPDMTDVRHHCRSTRYRRFGMGITPDRVVFFDPVENDGDFEPPGNLLRWLDYGAGLFLRGIIHEEGDLTTFFLWDQMNGLREVTGQYLFDELGTAPEKRFKRNDVVRIIDPLDLCHSERARGRLAQVIRAAPPLVIVNVDGAGVIAVDPLLLHPAQRAVAAA